MNKTKASFLAAGISVILFFISLVFYYFMGESLSQKLIPCLLGAVILFIFIRLWLVKKGESNKPNQPYYLGQEMAFFSKLALIAAIILFFLTIILIGLVFSSGFTWKKFLLTLLFGGGAGALLLYLYFYFRKNMG